MSLGNFFRLFGNSIEIHPCIEAPSAKWSLGFGHIAVWRYLPPNSLGAGVDVRRNRHHYTKVIRPGAPGVRRRRARDVMLVHQLMAPIVIQMRAEFMHAVNGKDAVLIPGRV